MGVDTPQGQSSAVSPRKARRPRTPAGGRTGRATGVYQARPPSPAAPAEPTAGRDWDRIRNDNWPLLIVASTIAVEAAILAQADPRIRGPLVLWFSLVCTGMAWVRLLRLAILPEMVAGVAVSVALSGLVSAAFLYSGHWSPSGTMVVLQFIALTAVLMEHWLYRSD